MTGRDSSRSRPSPAGASPPSSRDQPGQRAGGVHRRLSIELIEDFYWDISQVYDRFDTDPSTTATSGTDWGVISGLRYTFD
jgi:hypothetical protein